MANKLITKKRSMKTSTRDMSLGLLVSDRVQLEDVRLIGCECVQKPNASNAKKKFTITYSTQVETDEQNGRLAVIPKFHFEAFTEDSAEKPVIVIIASFGLLYRLESFAGLTQENFKQFSDANGIYNAWPYWREFVQNTVARMGLPPLAIPVFRLVRSSAPSPGEKKGKSERPIAKKEGVPGG